MSHFKVDRKPDVPPHSGPSAGVSMRMEPLQMVHNTSTTASSFFCSISSHLLTLFFLSNTFNRECYLFKLWQYIYNVLYHTVICVIIYSNIFEKEKNVQTMCEKDDIFSETL